MVPSEACDEPSHVPPSPEAVKTFARWLKKNGVSSTYEHEGYTHGIPFTALTFRLDDVAVAGQTWAVRLGVAEAAPSGQALSVSNNDKVNRISSHFDAQSGADITRSPRKEVPGRTFRRIDETMFQEIVAAFQRIPLEAVKVRTYEKWGRLR